jgi:hypothetical protein
MKNKDLPVELRKKVRNYMDYVFEQNKIVKINEKEIF